MLHSARENPDAVVALVEQARQDGPEQYIARALLELAEVAKATGVTRERFAIDMMMRSIEHARADPDARGALARLLVRQARLLDPEALGEKRCQW